MIGNILFPPVFEHVGPVQTTTVLPLSNGSADREVYQAGQECLVVVGCTKASVDAKVNDATKMIVVVAFIVD
jgi:hypothetical protein